MDIGTSFYCQTYDEAMKEVKRRKLSPEGQNMLHRIVNSPYGNGYIVRSIDPEFYCESIIDGPGFNFQPGQLGFSLWPKSADR